MCAVARGLEGLYLLSCCAAVALWARNDTGVRERARGASASLAHLYAYTALLWCGSGVGEAISWQGSHHYAPGPGAPGRPETKAVQASVQHLT